MFISEDEQKVCSPRTSGSVYPSIIHGHVMALQQHEMNITIGVNSKGLYLFGSRFGSLKDH